MCPETPRHVGSIVVDEAPGSGRGIYAGQDLKAGVLEGFVEARGTSAHVVSPALRLVAVVHAFKLFRRLLQPLARCHAPAVLKRVCRLNTHNAEGSSNTSSSTSMCCAGRSLPLMAAVCCRQSVSPCAIVTLSVHGLVLMAADSGTLFMRCASKWGSAMRQVSGVCPVQAIW